MKNYLNKQRLVQLDETVAGPLFMISAALLFTLLNLLIKLMGPEYDVWDIGFYRFLGGVLVLVALFRRHKNPFKGNNIRLLIIRGCTGSIAFISMVTAIRALPVSTAIVIFFSFPAFSAIFSFLIYGEKIKALEMACIATVLIGTGILFDFTITGSLFGQAMALIGGVFAGLTVTLIRTLRETNGPVVIYLYFCTMGAIVTAPLFILNPVLPTTAIEWSMIIAIVFTSLTAQLLMNQGFFYCTGWEGGVFMSSEVIFTAIVGITFLGDPATWRFWTGGLIIFGSVATLNRLKADSKN